MVYATVEEGPLIINLLESGSVKPREQITIKSQVEGRVSILYIRPEGERVKKGDLLVELDASTMTDNKLNQEITVQNAKSSYVQAEENLEVVKNQAQADVEKAELNLRFAEEDLTKYKDGEYPKILNEAQSKVTLSEEELKRAQDKLEWSQKLFDEKYLSESEFLSDKLSCRRHELDLKSAKKLAGIAGEIYVQASDCAVGKRRVAEQDGLGAYPSQLPCQRGSGRGAAEGEGTGAQSPGKPFVEVD